MRAQCSSSQNSDLASSQCKPLFNHMKRPKATYMYDKHVSKIKMPKLTVLAYICPL